MIHSRILCGFNQAVRREHLRIIRFLLTATLCLLTTASTIAQDKSVNRVVAQVNDAVRTAVRGNLHPLALAQNDQGLQDPSSNLDRVTMFFRMTAAQQSDLESLLAQQQGRASPNFHKWLSPEEYAGRFGVSQSDMDMVAAWLRTQGLTIGETARSGNWIAFTGSVSQVQAAFRTELHRYSARGKNILRKHERTSVPDAFAGLILGFAG